MKTRRKRDMRRRAAIGRSRRRGAVAAVAPVLVLPALLLGGSSVPVPHAAPASPEPRELGASGALPQAPRLNPRVIEDLGAPQGVPRAERPEGELGIPGPVLAAYRDAANRTAQDEPRCRLHWSVLASVGRIESGHARGGAIDVDGNTTRAILGPRLDGGPEVAAVPDTDGGQLDGDPVWDRAVGPMQFIPSTWRKHSADGNGDGRRDPHNVHDATAAAARYLCAGRSGLDDRENLARAVFSYNRSESYVRTVLVWAEAYARGVVPTPAELSPEVDDVLAGARLPRVAPMPEPPPLRIPDPQPLALPADPPPPPAEPLPPVDPRPLAPAPDPAPEPQDEQPPAASPEPPATQDPAAPSPTAPAPVEPHRPEPPSPEPPRTAEPQPPASAQSEPAPSEPAPSELAPSESARPEPQPSVPAAPAPSAPVPPEPAVPGAPTEPPEECEIAPLEAGEFALLPPEPGADLLPRATDPAELRPGLPVFTDDGRCAVPTRW